MMFTALVNRVLRRNSHASRQNPAALAVPARQGAPVERPARAEPPPALQNGELRLPLAAFLVKFPVEVQRHAKKDRVAGATMVFPQEKILALLGSGLVRMPFGEIRRSAADAFDADHEHDTVMVTLPPKDLFKHLGPAMIQRRPQKTLEVPEDIGTLFGSRKSWSQELPAFAEKVFAPTVEPDAVPSVTAAHSSPDIVIPQPAPNGGVSANQTIRTSRVADSLASVSQASVPNHSKTDAAVAASKVEPVNVVPTARSAQSHAPAAEEVPSTPLTAPVLPTPSVPSAFPEVELLRIPLAALAGRCPEALKPELAAWNLSQAQLTLPLAEVEAGLKRGKLSYPWKTLRQAVTPPPSQSASAHDAVEVELSIATVASAFLARRKKMETDRAPANAVHLPELADPAIPLSPATVVAAAVRLNGVNGALIVLPDGLRVASQLDSFLDADFYAAMLPQAYSMMRRWTKDMRFGELADLTFTAGDRAWKILRINGLFFGACGRKADELPVAQLTHLAARLRHWEGD